MADRTQVTEILAKDLDEYTQRVGQMEDGGGLFLDSTVQVVDGEALNRTVFTLLAPGELPDTAPSFVKLGGLPDGQAAAWTGVLVLGGRNTAAEMVRTPIDEEATP